MSNFDSWTNEGNQWQDATAHVPSLVREDIVKGKYKLEGPKRGPISLHEDPLAVQYSLGYKDRRYSLTYDTIKQTVQNLALLNAIINLRSMQVATFAQPYRLTKSLGFAVRHKDPGKMTTKGEREMIQSIEQFIYNAGAKDPNPHSQVPRDDFETFLKKIVRDSMMYDQACFELIPDRRGTPYEFIAVDASTIRIAASTHIFGPNETYHDRPPTSSNSLLLNHTTNHPFRTLKLVGKNYEETPAYVQVINGQIENIYSRGELAFGVRNPRSDIYVQGYGYSEVEQLITVITSHLFAEEYNRRFFMQGSMPKGLLNLRGDSMTADELEGFRRQWRANLEGVEASWKTPIFQSEAGIDWINLNQSNRDMEYGAWLEYLTKLSTAVFLVDPAELNFDLSGGVQQTPLFESSSEWKLKASRDRGLKPLLRFIAKLINDNIVARIDDHFAFDFIGLDELSEQEKHELRKEQLATYWTLNEVRREQDLPDVEAGDLIMNPTYLQALQTKQTLAQQAKEAEQGAEGAQGGQPSGDPGAPDQSAGVEQQKQMPQYSDTFVKSQGTIEISLGDEYDDWYAGW